MRTKGQNLYSDRLNGLHISTKTINKIKEVVNQKQLFIAYRKSVNYEEMIQWIAKNLGLDPKMVKKYLDQENLLNAQEEYIGQDEDEGSLFSGLAAQNPQEIFIHSESLIEMLDVFNEVFSKTQERVKPYLSRLLSAKYYGAAVEARELKKEYSFFDYEKIAVWSREKNVPNQKDIAESWNKNESDASRTIEKFEKKVREKIRACKEACPSRLND